jgi:MoaA/NifB/PqqE/SkfB family radical SAM enzyme
MMIPARLNLSIGHACFVSCPGCYTHFGRRAAPLSALVQSVASFVQLGIRDVTISGGDPLLIPDVLAFLADLRRVGVRHIKLDTMGTAWVDPQFERAAAPLPAVLSAIDVLALPLDGWSNESAAQFRRGRPHLFDETCALLACIGRLGTRTHVFINTVVTRHNYRRLHDVYRVLRTRGVVRHWNVFQYTPTDHVDDHTNAEYSLTSNEFADVRQTLEDAVPAGAAPFEVEFASVADRLGAYLLINSDGDVWLPDACGRTLVLGRVFAREPEIVDAWSAAVARLPVMGPSHGVCRVRA